MKFLALLFPLVLAASGAVAQDAAVFYRGINVGGPAAVIDGNKWLGQDDPAFECTAPTTENQDVALTPAVQLTKATMLRSSRYGGNLDATVKNIPAGDYQVFVYVWEDNNSEKFDLLLNGQTAAAGVVSGIVGTWQRVGPWRASPQDGVLQISARGGTANLSGIEIWQGTGPIPLPDLGFAKDPTPDQIAYFENKIRPLLVTNCYECHSTKSKKLGGGLLLDSLHGIRRGGDSGPPVQPLDSENSLLLRAVRHVSADLTMPPKKKLATEQIAELETWIRMGAPDPRTEDTLAILQQQKAATLANAQDWWSFKPIAAAAPPAVSAHDWAGTEIDRFLLAKMQPEGLQPAPPATKETLIRRVNYDLIGLPPTPAEVDAFLADTAPDAFAKVVDRLLASPHYGERWGRHWLDVVRYADTAGDNSDFPIPQIYKYRNWVIDAINRDLPYDQFIQQQLAGDLLSAPNPNEKTHQLIATGYIANARRFGSRVDDYPQHLTIEDTLDNVGRAFLGLSLTCARCHDHKFDPISTEDYYSLYGFFSSTRYPWPGIELAQYQKDLVPLTPPDQIEAARKAWEHPIREAEAELACRRHAASRLENPARELAERENKELAEHIKKLKAMPPQVDYAYAVGEGEKIGDAAVQQKGDPAKPQAIAKRRFLPVLDGMTLPPDDKSSGRKSLAAWIASPANPLTARVMVNRIWQGHFGKALVPTPNDFGHQGQPPSHPELLDWLARDFMQNGWSMKQMHRRILSTRAYQMSSERTNAASDRDPANTLLSSFPRQRLDAESLRDTLLLLGGSLDKTPGGEHPFPAQASWKFTQHDPFKAVYETNKRSVYLMTQRIQRHPFLAIFDGADPSASTARRTSSTTPLQALFLLNDPTVHQQAEQLARKICRNFPDDPARLRHAWKLALSRLPDAAEEQTVLAYLQKTRDSLAQSGTTPDQLDASAWASQIRTLFRLNEFLYLD